MQARPLRLWLPLIAMLGAASCRKLPAAAGSPGPVQQPGAGATHTPGSGAAPTPQLGRVAYVRHGDLWVKALPDGEPRRLTQDGHNRAPRWSPSGEWLAFVKGAKQPWELWLTRSSGGEPQRVDWLGTGPGQKMAWSPASDRLAYISQDGLLVTLDADGSDRRELGTPSEGVPGTGAQALSWSPDGQYLASVYVVQRKPGSPGQYQEPYAVLWRIRSDESEATELLNAGRPSTGGFIVVGWSPDGTFLLYWPQPMFSASLLADGVPLMAVPASGGTPQEVTAGMLAYQDFLTWSPDGRLLALVEGTSRATWESKSIAVGALGSLQRRSDPDRADLFPAWSPDGRWIAYTSGPAESQIGGGEAAQRALEQRRIWLMAPDGSNRRLLVDDPTYRDERPRWSRDGSWLLFTRMQGDQAQLWLVKADGTALQQVVEELGPLPGWFGFYGYIDWSALYDWWPGMPAGAPR